VKLLGRGSSSLNCSVANGYVYWMGAPVRAVAAYRRVHVFERRTHVAESPSAPTASGMCTTVGPQCSVGLVVLFRNGELEH
jgi:hypothetical protein